MPVAGRTPLAVAWPGAGGRPWAVPPVMPGMAVLPLGPPGGVGIGVFSLIRAASISRASLSGRSPMSHAEYGPWSWSAWRAIWRAASRLPARSASFAADLWNRALACLVSCSDRALSAFRRAAWTSLSRLFGVSSNSPHFWDGL